MYNELLIKYNSREKKKEKKRERTAYIGKKNQTCSLNHLIYDFTFSDLTPKNVKPVRERKVNGISTIDLLELCIP